MTDLTGMGFWAHYFAVTRLQPGRAVVEGSGGIADAADGTAFECDRAHAGRMLREMLRSVRIKPELSSWEELIGTVRLRILSVEFANGYRIRVVTRSRKA